MRQRALERVYHFGVMALLLAILNTCGPRVTPEELIDWGLPGDFPGSVQSLRELKLPPKVRRLDWLPQGIEVLDASQTELEGTRGLPSTLKRLDLRYVQIKALDDLPPHLEALDLAWTDVSRLDGLPRSLRSLVLGGYEIDSLDGLPPNLEILTLEDTAVTRLDVKFTNLRSLTLVNGVFEDLESLPPTLTSLSLQATTVEILGLLPNGLRSLELRRNQYQSLLPATLPPFLVKLSTDRLPLDLSSLTRLVRLERLELSELSELSNEVLGSLPPSVISIKAVSVTPDIKFSSLSPELTEFELPGCAATELKTWPEKGMRLRRLNLALCAIDRLPSLPATLQVLDLSGTLVQDLSGLQPGLKVLTLGWWTGEKLPPLPEGLEVLSLAGSVDLESIDKLPDSLVALDLSDVGLSKLPDLPRSLRRLDISGTEIRLSSLQELPRNLEELTLSPGCLLSMKGAPPTLRSLRFRESRRLGRVGS